MANAIVVDTSIHPRGRRLLLGSHTGGCPCCAVPSGRCTADHPPRCSFEGREHSSPSRHRGAVGSKVESAVRKSGDGVTSSKPYPIVPRRAIRTTAE
jgi:hypothetical protein